jgi:uncharacterized damage-inducible protein DinB
MPRPRIDELLRLMANGFEEGEFSLLANLGSVDDVSWTALPEGGHRSIRDLTAHVGMFKFMYANHAFRDASFDYSEDPATPPDERLSTPSAAVEWLSEGHAYLTTAIDELTDDAELGALRKAHWGGMVPTEALLTIMVQHDLFHAGEINHARALLQDTDRWYIPDPP